MKHVSTIRSARRQTPILYPHLLALGVAVGCQSAHATTWQVNDEWGLTTNTTLSLGTSWALQNADKFQMTAADAASIGKTGTGVNYNADNGKLNFNKGDTISTVFKGLTDFDLNDGSQGAFVRFKYWYDHALETGNGDFEKFNDSGWQDLARFQGFEVLDAYVWKDFNVADHSLNVKVGNQVLSWGEALFIQNGVNVINPLDVSAFNRPGVELKEGQLPVEMVSFNFDLSDSVSLEGFWQYNFRPSVYDGCGTFFSIADNLQEGCQNNYLIAGGTGTTAQSLQDFNPAAGAANAQRERYLQRTSTDYPSDTGQYGLAMHYTIESLHDADLGLYYINYHSRTPQLQGVIARQAPVGANVNINTGDYSNVYPEDIRLFGASLSGVIGTTATFGELSYRPNMPLAFNGADFVGLLAGSGTTPIMPLTPAQLAAARGSEVEGYARKPIWQFSLGAVDTVSNVMGANRLSLTGEMGFNWIENIDGDRFGRAGGFGRTLPATGVATSCVGAGAGGMSAAQVAQMNADFCNTDGIYTDFSWGYRLRAGLSYEQLLPATVITPAINWRHDVEGYGPNFQEGQQALGLTLTFDYRNDYSLEFAYNEFLGTNKFSTIDDRDFASVNLKVSF
ncbi:DUF1302 domain-containing protein [Pseudomonas sp. URMO17WK12:I12]|jgi:hypothetical protein|uniref:DUF1302 domain-containing protein n=1 Tax=Pseudomonas sp. URMO17WK12:I12 TaxID=1259797 RepID=UPI0004BC576B|nr:DUF1302 domain-containing protein [Pseudomonas sp. URMO17WK12:I12]